MPILTTLILEPAETVVPDKSSAVKNISNIFIPLRYKSFVYTLVVAVNPLIKMKSLKLTIGKLSVPPVVIFNPG